MGEHLAYSSPEADSKIEFATWPEFPRWPTLA